MFRNSPQYRTVNGENQVMRHSHANITIDDGRGVNISISEDGKITFTQAVKTLAGSNEPTELVSVTVSASTIYKINRLLLDTKKSEWVPVSQVRGSQSPETKN